MKKTLMLGLAGAAVVVPKLHASPAAAAPPGCAANSLCYWIDTNFGNVDGGSAGFTASSLTHFSYQSRYACYPPHGGQYSNRTWNDCASSLANSRAVSGTYVVYRDVNGQGDNFAMPPGSQLASLPSKSQGSMSDAISSAVYS